MKNKGVGRLEARVFTIKTFAQGTGYFLEAHGIYLHLDVASLQGNYFGQPMIFQMFFILVDINTDMILMNYTPEV